MSRGWSARFPNGEIHANRKQPTRTQPLVSLREQHKNHAEENRRSAGVATSLRRRSSELKGGSDADGPYMQNGWQMSTLSRVALNRAVNPADPAASRQANGRARKVGIIGLAVFAVVALGVDPGANASPAPGCPQGRAPGPGPGCGRRAFLTDIAAAGFGDSNGNTVALDQGLDMCGLMDAGLTRQEMVSQFSALNPALGPAGAAQVVQIAIRDLCPWHR